MKSEDMSVNLTGFLTLTPKLYPYMRSNWTKWSSGPIY